MYGDRLVNVGEPVELSDAATKQYVDNAISAAIAELRASSSLNMWLAFLFSRKSELSIISQSQEFVNSLKKESKLKTTCFIHATC